MSQRKFYLYYFILIVAIIEFDQLSKLLILQNLNDYQSIPVLPFFNIVLIYNTGAAFGFLSSAGGWQNTFFMIMAIFASILICYLIAKSKSWLESIAYSLILGGAIGNLIDRVRIGKVVDFLDFHFAEKHFPAFNVADSAITIGVTLMIVLIVFGKDKSS